MSKKVSGWPLIVPKEVDTSGLPEITNSDEGKVLTVVDNSGTLEAEWAEPSGSVAIDDLEDEITSAIGTAVTNANTSGYQGVTISAFGSTTTQAKAALVSTIATSAKSVTLGDNEFTLIARYVNTFEPDPDPIIGGYMASFDFLYPVYIQGLNGYSLIVHVANGTSGQDATLSISVSATKLINYPSN